MVCASKVGFLSLYHCPLRILFFFKAVSFLKPHDCLMQLSDMSCWTTRLKSPKNLAAQLTPSCATTGEGLFEGLQWLSQNVKGTKS